MVFQGRPITTKLYRQLHAYYAMFDLSIKPERDNNFYHILSFIRG